MRVVLDTNVFVSGIFFGGVPGMVLDLRKAGDVELVMTEAILSEYEDVLRAYSDDAVHRFRACRPGVGAKRRWGGNHSSWWSA